MAEAQALATATQVAPSAPAMNNVPGANESAAASSLAVGAPQASAPRASLLERVGRAAVDESDSEELRLQKTLLIFASGLMNMAAIVWLAIYWVMGLKLPTTIPLLYQALSAIILVVYLKTRNFNLFCFAQLSLFLFAPFVIQWTIGSFVSSSGIVLLALLAPVGAMVVLGARESVPWFVAYVVLTVLSGVFDYFTARAEISGDSRVDMRTVAVFFVLNFTILSSIVYLLLRYFVLQKDHFQAELEHQHVLVLVDALEGNAAQVVGCHLLGPHQVGIALGNRIAALAVLRQEQARVGAGARNGPGAVVQGLVAGGGREWGHDQEPLT
jgi:hypothetical protein